MKKPVWIGLGILLILIGGVWGLQGLGVFGGSGMSGKTLWAVVGPIVAVVGVILLVTGLRVPSRR
jgi:hypothetical protein